MEYQRKLREFLSTYQSTGWILLLMAGGLLLQALVYVLLSLFGGSDLYNQVLGNLALPAAGRPFIFRPWTLVTYPFFNAATTFTLSAEGTYLSGPFPFFRIIFDGLILWYVGRIHQQFLGEDRTRRLYIAGIPLIGFLTVLLGSFLFDRENVTALFLSGMRPVVILMLVSVTTLAPNYPVPLFLFGRVRMVYVTVVLVLLSFFSGYFLSAPLGLAVLLASLFGFLHVYLLQKGLDSTEAIWSFYQEKPSRSRMKVSHRAYSQEAEESPRNSEPLSDNITQEDIDSILDKISAKGYESLSRREKEILFRASSQQEDE